VHDNYAQPWGVATLLQGACIPLDVDCARASLLSFRKRWTICAHVVSSRGGITSIGTLRTAFSRLVANMAQRSRANFAPDVIVKHYADIPMPPSARLQPRRLPLRAKGQRNGQCGRCDHRLEGRCDEGSFARGVTSPARGVTSPRTRCDFTRLKSGSIKTTKPNAQVPRRSRAGPCENESTRRRPCGH
jgi:hypothetical protein